LLSYNSNQTAPKAGEITGQINARPAWRNHFLGFFLGFKTAPKRPGQWI
jgi:hypothetical protein